MNHLKKPIVLTCLTAAAGFVCLLLRQWLLGSGLDDRGQLQLTHPVSILIWLLTALIAAALLLPFVTWDKQTTCVFPLTPLQGMASLFQAAAYGVTVWNLLSNALGMLSLIAGVLGAVSVLCTGLIAFGQFRHQRMHPLLYCPGVLFLLVCLISSYSQWSGEPQAHNFFFQMMSCVFLVFTVFCRAELAAGKISGRNYLVFSRAAIFLCISAIAHCPESLQYLLFAMALLLDGCGTMQKSKAPETQESPTPSQE